MKKIKIPINLSSLLIVIIMTIVAFSSFSSTNEEKPKATAIIAADKMNVLYRSLINPISVCVSGYSLEDIILTASQAGELTKTGAGKYTFKPTKVDSIGYVIFSVGVKKHNRDVEIIGTNKFKLKDLPPPSVFLCRSNYGNISKKELLAYPRLFALFPDLLIHGISFDIISFDLIVVDTEKGLLVDKNVKGSEIPNEDLASIGELGSSKTTLIVHNVVITGPGGIQTINEGSVYRLKP
jgi:hypothetical protein